MINTVPIVIIARTRKYIRVFKRAMATTPGSAINIREHGINKSLIFNKLVRQHIIIKADNDQYYLDEKREHEVMKKKRAIVITVMAVMIIIAMLITAMYKK